MQMTRWNPFSEMDDFFKTYQRAMTRGGSHEGMLSTDWTPSVDITENDAEFLIKAELPEVKKEDISVDVKDGVVTISGERRSETKDDKEHRIERFFGSFSRSFSLPANVSEAEISAENKDGMLYLHLPKSAQQKPEKIQVEVK
ncbi:MAG: Hsp20/alpha crystallin family protein [bacterium]